MNLSVSGYNPYMNNIYGTAEYNNTGAVSEAEEKALKRSGRVRCETCAERKYQDGSNEMNVSFKAPGHISPQASAATVMAHEQQHVSNAYSKAGRGNGKVVSATVSLHTSVCPECGRSYVSGGTTSTAIKYSNDEYGNSRKTYDAANGAVGGNFDEAV